VNVFYSLGEVVFNKGQADERPSGIKKAADTDPFVGQAQSQAGPGRLNRATRITNHQDDGKSPSPSDPTSAEARKRKQSSNSSKK